MVSEAEDRRFMAAAIRLSRRHVGLTATNPSVATLIVRDDGSGPYVVGRGITAQGGRPHAETQALAEAGEAARGATAYVTLEPCAHHGRTPPCAEALVAAGIVRVVGAAADPDPRVSGKGYAILRAAGIEVTEDVLAREAAVVIEGYLTRSVKKRPQVILKLAISADGMIGRKGEGQLPISGPLSRRQAHLMRAAADAILIGAGTAAADDPELTCRLAGLEERSPARIVLDPGLRLSPASKLALTAKEVPVYVAAPNETEGAKRKTLAGAGVGFLAAEMSGGRIALPELMEDLAARGFMSMLVEGGAETARAFLGEGLVDRVVVFRGPAHLGADAIPAPFDVDAGPDGYRLSGKARYGDDLCFEYERGA